MLIGQWKRCSGKGVKYRLLTRVVGCTFELGVWPSTSDRTEVVTDRSFMPKQIGTTAYRGFRTLEKCIVVRLSEARGPKYSRLGEPSYFGMCANWTMEKM